MSDDDEDLFPHEEEDIDLSIYVLDQQPQSNSPNLNSNEPLEKEH